MEFSEQLIKELKLKKVYAKAYAKVYAKVYARKYYEHKTKKRAINEPLETLDTTVYLPVENDTGGFQEVDVLTVSSEHYAATWAVAMAKPKAKIKMEAKAKACIESQTIPCLNKWCSNSNDEAHVT